MDPSDRCEVEDRLAVEDVCKKCDGNGYVESFDYDQQSNVVITLCTDCGPAPGDFDR